MTENTATLKMTGLWYQFTEYRDYVHDAPIRAVLFDLIEQFLACQKGGAFTKEWGADRFLEQLEIRAYSVYGQHMEGPRLEFRIDRSPLQNLTDNLAHAVLASLTAIGKPAPGRDEWEAGLFVVQACTRLYKILATYERRQNPPRPPARPRLWDRVRDLVASPYPAGVSRQPFVIPSFASIYERFMIRGLEREQDMPVGPVEGLLFYWLSSLRNRQGWLIEFPKEGPAASALVDGVAVKIGAALAAEKPTTKPEIAQVATCAILSEMRDHQLAIPGQTSEEKGRFVVHLLANARAYFHAPDFKADDVSDISIQRRRA